MITLIHGEDTLQSRNYYFDVKKRAQESITIDGVTVLLTDLQQALSGDDLFGTKKDIFIENVFSKRKSQKEIEAISQFLSESSSKIVLWESKELTTKQIGLLKNATIKIFKIPSTIFALLDGLKPKNGKQLLQLFYTTLQDKDAEFVLVMLQRQVRILLSLISVIPAKAGNQSSRHSELGSESSWIPDQVRDDKCVKLGMTTISEVARLAPWQKGKLEKQAKLFSMEQLITLHQKLFDLELAMKTGGLSLPLAEAIDLLLISL